MPVVTLCKWSAVGGVWRAHSDVPGSYALIYDMEIEYSSLLIQDEADGTGTQAGDRWCITAAILNMTLR